MPTRIKQDDAEKLLEAARVLVGQNIGDKIYDVREREGKGWDGPLVTAWNKASMILAEMDKKYPKGK